MAETPNNATPENLAKLARLIAIRQPLNEDAASEAIDLCVVAWAADKALIKALVDAFGYRGYALDGFCKWVCQSCKAELVTTDTEGPEAMEHKAGCIVAPARGGEQT